MAYVQFSSNHIGDQHGQRLRRSTSSTDWTCKMNRNKLRTVDVVQKSYLADPLQGRHEHRFGQHGQANSQPDVDGFLKVVAFFAETSRNGLSDDDGRCFSVVFFQQLPNIVRYFVTVEMFNEQFFCSPCEVGGTRDFDPILVVKSETSGRFGNPIGFIRPFIKPAMIPLHFIVQPVQIQPEKRVEFTGFNDARSVTHVQSTN